jgi:hypothetical protein
VPGQVQDRTKRSPEREERFLAALRTGTSVYGSACAAGVARTTVYEWRNGDPDFKARWDDAFEAGTDIMEDEALRRAVKGCEKPVFYKGGIAGYITEFSDGLLNIQLGARRRAKYSPKQDGGHHGTVTVTVTSYAGPPEPEPEPGPPPGGDRLP